MIIKHFLLFLVTHSYNIGVYSQSPAITSNDLKLLIGEWKGSLTYLDYSTGNPYTMPANVSISQLPNSDRFVFSHSYPNEPKANGRDTVTITKNGKLVNNEIVTSIKRFTNGNTEIITEYNGADGNDNMPAIIRHTYNLGKLTYVKIKEVRFNGDSAWVKRHEFSYQRE